MPFDSHRLLKWRRTKGFSQFKAAEVLGITQAYLCELETGKKEPSFSMLESIAMKTKIPVGEFSTSNPPHPRSQQETA